MISIETLREAEEFLSSSLFDLGTTGIITLEESDETIKLGAYFDSALDPEEIGRAIESVFLAALRRDELLSFSSSIIPDQDWMQKWKEGYEAVEAGERLIVAPSWKLPGVTGERLVIRIDPGMAFGTGTHETTRLCLEAIERFWRGSRLLDVGCGTGILAIAAALLEPRSSIVAVDIDPVAVEVARENIEINRVSELIEVREGGPDGFAGTAFDVVVANLTAEVIIELMSDLICCLAPSGVLILSGVLTDLRDRVEKRATDAGLTIIEGREAGEWSALAARR